MRIPLVLALIALPLASPAGAAYEERVHEFTFDGRLYYIEERHWPNVRNGVQESVFDSTLRVYEEANHMEGLQHGGVGLLGDWFPPGCDQSAFEDGDAVWLAPGPDPIDDPVGWAARLHIYPAGNVGGVPCIVIDEDYVDENYGNGPDVLITTIPWIYTDEDYVETVRNLLGRDLDPFSPSNDYFVNATVELESFFREQSTVGASIEPGEPLCPGQAATVWFQFTPQVTQWYAIETRGDFGTSLGLYSGGPIVQTLTPLLCSDSWQAFEGAEWQSRSDLILTANVTYYVQAGGYDGDTGNLILWTQPYSA